MNFLLHEEIDATVKLGNLELQPEMSFAQRTAQLETPRPKVPNILQGPLMLNCILFVFKLQNVALKDAFLVFTIANHLLALA